MVKLKLIGIVTSEVIFESAFESSADCVSRGY